MKIYKEEIKYFLIRYMGKTILTIYGNQKFIKIDSFLFDLHNPNLIIDFKKLFLQINMTFSQVNQGTSNKIEFDNISHISKF